MRRRDVIAGLAAGVLAPAAQAHTLYNQWVVYRQKHLLIGSHRQDPPSFAMAQEIEAILGHLLPEASARAARAPHPERLASLLGTGQMFVAVLNTPALTGIMAGEGRFAPYGAVPLTFVGHRDDHWVAAHESLPVHHAWLLAAALAEVSFNTDIRAAPPAPRHPGAQAFLDGTPFEEMQLPG
jgi:hypothetical protein